MKTMLLTLSMLYFGILNYTESPSNFESKLSNIIMEFRHEILNLDKCENLMQSTESLINEIEESIENKEEYTLSELLELKNIKIEAEAIEQLISILGINTHHTMTVKEFEIANKKVNLSISNEFNEKYCVEIIKVRLNDYVSYIVKNNSQKNFKISYKWIGKSITGTVSGNGNFGLSKQSMRHLYDNRENISCKNITIKELNCKEY